MASLASTPVHPDPSIVLVVQDLCKTYGALRALQGVSLEIPQGCVFGLLGPNGSGKTSLLGVILGILSASSGTFAWRAGLKRAALLETPNFYPYLNGRENLRIVARLRGRGEEQIEKVLEEVGLAGHPNLSFGKYSLGMKQRLAIAACLLGQPEMVVLDEPTNGLDPSGIADVRDLIRAMGEQGRTVLLASHLLDEVEKVCTHVAILKKGRVLTQGPLGEVLRDEDSLELASQDLKALEALLSAHPLQPRVERKEEKVVVRFPAEMTSPAEVNAYCMERGQVLHHLNLRKKTLESRFLELTD